MRVLVGLSVAHLLNDTIQAVLPAMYPMLKESYHLSFTQIGMITFGFQVTASVLQPLVGHYTDRRPLPYSLPWGMGFTLIGIILLAAANSYAWLLVASVLVGTGSAIFHPEASRLARLASGGRHGFAQSLFQVGEILDRRWVRWPQPWWWCPAGRLTCSGLRCWRAARFCC